MPWRGALRTSDESPAPTIDGNGQDPKFFHPTLRRCRFGRSFPGTLARKREFSCQGKRDDADVSLDRASLVSVFD